MKQSEYLKMASNAIRRLAGRSTQILLSERYGNKYSYGGLFDNDILEDDGVLGTSDNFKAREGERILLKTDKIKWVENNSLGLLTLTDQRLFYQPQFWDVAQTEKNVEIDLNHINKVGLLSLRGMSVVVLFVGNSNIRFEFTSPVPFKLLKFWRALHGVNKNWKVLKS
jgi:hypothetical protein